MLLGLWLQMACVAALVACVATIWLSANLILGVLVMTVGLFAFVYLVNFTLGLLGGTNENKTQGQTQKGGSEKEPGSRQPFPQEDPD